MLRNKKGLTLVEVMIALLVLLFVSLALMQTALVSIEANTKNLIRQEVVTIGERRMSEAVNTNYEALVTAPGPLWDWKSIKDSWFLFRTQRVVDDRGDYKIVNISVYLDEWNAWKGKDQFKMTLSSIVRKP